MTSQPLIFSKRASATEFTILMALLMSIIAISIDALLPALGVIATEFHIASRNHVQYVIGFLFIGMAVGQLLCGPLSDALGRKKILYVGIGLYLIGSAICFMAQDFSILLAGRLIQGVGVAGPYVSAMSIVRDRYTGRDMARIMSIIMMIFITVPAIAPSLGQAILFLASWRAVFVLYIVYSIAIGVWLSFRLEETLPPEKRIPFHVGNIIDGFREVISNRTTVGYMICMGICFGSFIGYLNSSQQIFQIQFHVGKIFTVYFGLLALILGVASLLNSYFVERLGMRYICFRSMACIVGASAPFSGPAFPSSHPALDVHDLCRYPIFWFWPDVWQYQCHCDGTDGACRRHCFGGYWRDIIGNFHDAGHHDRPAL